MPSSTYPKSSVAAAQGSPATIGKENDAVPRLPGGTEVQRLTDRPFGETYTNQGSKDFEKHGFTGQEEDPETGLYFYRVRYYNPALGRFLSPDPIVPDPGNPQSLNRYSYVENNPVNKTDPTGHFSFTRLFRGPLPRRSSKPAAA